MNGVLQYEHESMMLVYVLTSGSAFLHRELVVAGRGCRAAYVWQALAPVSFVRVCATARAAAGETRRVAPRLTGRSS